jgi:hypothetical protein
VFGFAKKEKINLLHDSHFYYQNCLTIFIRFFVDIYFLLAQCSLWIYSNTTYIHCGETRVYSSNDGYPSGSLFAFELNTMTGILYFFVNNKQIGHCVKNIPKGVYFGV